jgi:negative regulator of flagellin synthesis FlgM
VSTKIDGLQNRPVQIGAGKQVSGTNEAAGAPAKTPSVETSTVHITEQARQLAALEQALNDIPVVNEARVAAIRNAIEHGRYEIDAERIADKLLHMERELGI